MKLSKKPTTTSKLQSHSLKAKVKSPIFPLGFVLKYDPPILGILIK